MRIKHARVHVEDPKVAWAEIHKSDETKLELFAHSMTQKVWRKKSKAYSPKTLPLLSSIVEAGSCHGAATLPEELVTVVRIYDEMDRAVYRKIFSTNLILPVKHLKVGRALKHMAVATKR